MEFIEKIVPQKARTRLDNIVDAAGFVWNSHDLFKTIAVIALGVPHLVR